MLNILSSKQNYQFLSSTYMQIGNQLRRVKSLDCNQIWYLTGKNTVTCPDNKDQVQLRPDRVLLEQF